MKKLMLGLMMAFAVTVAIGDTEVVNGIEWSFTVANGTASVGVGGLWGGAAISSSTSGKIIIPQVLGGCPVKSLADRAFFGCAGVSEVIISDGVEVIGQRVFDQCRGLRSVSVASTVNSIDYTSEVTGSFEGCDNLVSIEVDANNTRFASVDGVLYDKNIKTLLFRPRGKSAVEIPNSVSTVERNAFGNVLSITLEAGSRYLSMREGVLFDKECLTLLCCPRSVAILKIPASVVNIPDMSASGCLGNNLVSIEVEESNTVFRSISGVLYNRDLTELLKVPAKKTILEIPESIVSISGGAFLPVPYITTINVKSGNPVYASADGLLYDKGIQTLLYFPSSRNVAVFPDTVKNIEAMSSSLLSSPSYYDFEGKPPAGLGIIENDQHIRYNSAYEDDWRVAISAYGFQYATPYNPIGWEEREHRGDVNITVTNVVVNYVLNSVQPEFAIPATSDTGFVNIITEVKGGAVAVPASWADNYPTFTTKFGADFTKALAMKTGKKDGAGNDMFVWQDYVAGTDPTKEDDVFKASITIVDGKVTISYSPELDDERKALRKYTTLGKKSLLDTDWTVVQEGHESEYNFFKVSVEMK